MTDPEDLDEDLFADLYEDDAPKAAAPTAAIPPIKHEATPVQTSTSANTASPPTVAGDDVKQSMKSEISQDEGYDPGQSNDVAMFGNAQNGTNGYGWDGASGQDYSAAHAEEPHGTGIKEDGKMFIGGLNWETTDQSLKDYFSQFGEVTECTVMRDGATGRSRGFGFLTFKDPRTVNIVMVKEHYLDGKIIDPKRAIPRDEQEKTSKIFVGGVSQEATEQDFREYFQQFGRVLDATLMMDKDTGRPRGFGFVTFDSEHAVDMALAQPVLEIKGKPIEVKKAQPRGNIRERDEREERPYRHKGGREDRFDRDSRGSEQYGSNSNDQNQGGQQGQAMYGGMTPQMMAQYWQKMQQYWAVMQQQMAAVAAGRGAAAGQGQMGQMNPAMMQQMQQFQQMQAMGRGSGSPQGAGGMGAMNPAMMQQMQQAMQQQQAQQQAAQQQQQQQAMQQQQQAAMQQAQQQQQQQRQHSQGPPQGPQAGGYGSDGGYGGPPAGQPGYNAYEQQLFEQQKYEQRQRQQQQRAQRQMYQGAPQQQMGGGPTSWEGMYDDVPQPENYQSPGGSFRQLTPNRGPDQPHPTGNPNAPINAPTGPKNAGKPGANYRGGGRGGGGRGAFRGRQDHGYHPYARG